MNNKKIRRLIVLLAVSAALCFVPACSKNSSSGATSNTTSGAGSSGSSSSSGNSGTCTSG